MAETIEIKGCPMCGNDAPASAPRCTCGYVFSSSQPSESVEWEPGVESGAPGDGWRTAGWTLTVLGGLGIVASLFLDISVDGGYGGDDIVNLGLMFQKGYLTALSLCAIGLGVFSFGVDAIVKAIERNG